MKKILLSLLLLACLTGKSQCFVASIDTSGKAAISFGAPANISDSGYVQPVSFNLVCQGLNWPNFSKSVVAYIFVPNSMTVLQVQGYVMSKLQAWMKQNYPTH